MITNYQGCKIQSRCIRLCAKETDSKTTFMDDKDASARDSRCSVPSRKSCWKRRPAAACPVEITCAKDVSASNRLPRGRLLQAWNLQTTCYTSSRTPVPTLEVTRERRIRRDGLCYSLQLLKPKHERNVIHGKLMTDHILRSERMIGNRIQRWNKR